MRAFKPKGRINAGKSLALMSLLLLLSVSRLSQAADVLAALSGETISATGLITSAVSAFPACGRWQPTGICIYLVCSLFECHTEESVKYGHYNPDLVVSSYNSSSNDRVSGNPWTEGKAVTGHLSTSVAASLLQAVPSAGDFSHGKHQNMIFKEGDAIGHPAALITQQFDTTLVSN